MNDNRNYRYTENSATKRTEFGAVTKLIQRGSKIIDLGSGDGTLLKILKDRKKTKGLGVEISSSGVRAAKKKGIKSIVGRIDAKLPFDDKEFDYAICNATLQMVMYPEMLLSEMKRVSKKQIISFPNFAFILNRLDLLVNGVMPRVMIPAYKWFSTGHIHQLSIKDFEVYCKENNFKIINTAHIGPGKIFYLPSKFLAKLSPNLFAMMAIFMTQ
jgi:methionine biosynthesis protein MetW